MHSLTKIREILDFSKHHEDAPVVRSQRRAYRTIKGLLEEKKRFIIIKGIRGSGKTTILKNLLKETNALFTSGDFLLAKRLSIRDVIKAAEFGNKKWIFIDEIHYLPDWRLQIKLAVDSWSHKFGFVITGSSALSLEKAGDIKRRAEVLELKDFSFSEFLEINDVSISAVKTFPNFLFMERNLKKIFYKLVKIESQISRDYISYYDPFLKNPLPALLDTENKLERLREIIYSVIDEDIPKLYDEMSVKILHKGKDILNYLSQAEKSSLDVISKYTGISKTSVISLLELLESSGLIFTIFPKGGKNPLKGMKKYVFLAPAFRRAAGYLLEPSGFEREDLFCKIVRSFRIPIFYEITQREGFDFLVGKNRFEIGSEKKKEGIIQVVEGGELDFDGKSLIIPLEFLALFEW